MEKPNADIENVPYGPHERNVLDLWQAKSDAPAPLLVHIHGGGFRGGDKTKLRPSLLNGCLEAGIAVASINYRLSQHAKFPAPFQDGARAVQFLRLNAEQWNLDPNKMAATGGSAGGGISLWIGFHEDLADPDSEDPVARQSTPLTCMAVINTQSSYDMRFIQKLIWGAPHPHPALLQLYGLEPDELDTPRAHEMFEEASAINHARAGAPPVFMFYKQANIPLPTQNHGAGIHHPRFGEVLKEKLDGLGVECVLRYREDYEDGPTEPVIERVDGEIVQFLLRQFTR